MLAGTKQCCIRQAQRIFELALVGFMLATASIAGTAYGEESLTPYKPLRYDDDFTYLRNRIKSDDFWDPIKYVPLGGSAIYATFGGELRERVDHFAQPAFGLAHQRASLDDLLQRLLLNADLHLGPNVRLFLQVGSHGSVGILDAARRASRLSKRRPPP